MPRQPVTFEAVRSIGAALPEVKDASSTRGTALKIGRHLMACKAIHRSAEPNSLMIRISFKRRDELLEQNAKAYYLTEHYQPYPAILVRLSKISRTSLKGLLAESSKFLSEERA